MTARIAYRNGRNSEVTIPRFRLPIVSLDEVVRVRIVDELRALFPSEDDEWLRRSVGEAMERIAHLTASKVWEHAPHVVPEAMQRRMQGHHEEYEALK
jgi:hypothetical protein